MLKKSMNKINIILVMKVILYKKTSDSSVVVNRAINDGGFDGIFENAEIQKNLYELVPEEVKNSSKRGSQ
jgi:hypothetical protein